MTSRDERITLQAGIIKRFLSEKDFQEFMESYNSSKRGQEVRLRKATLEESVSDEERKAMAGYYKETDKPIKDLSKEMGVTPAKFYGLVISGSKKFTYRNF